MSQALYRKYRPKGWEEVVGQEHVVQTLKNAIINDRVGHAYLFAGPRGTGKTTLARILAKAVNCLAPDRATRPCNTCAHCTAVNENRFLDLIEMDAASNTGVEDVRDLRDKIGFSPTQGMFKVYIIDEVHMLSTPAFNALLKTLEEPPQHAIFVLATTEIHKIPATVLSRCQRHEFRRVPLKDIVANLENIGMIEGWQADSEVLVFIARQATGSIRDAQSLLDQLSSSGSPITLELAQTVLGTATSEAVLKLVDAIQDRRTGLGMEALREALDSGADPRTLARQMVEYLRGLMMIQLGNPGHVEATKEIRDHMQAHSSTFSTPVLIHMLKVFSAAATDTRGGSQPSLALELALAQAMDDRTESETQRPNRLGSRVEVTRVVDPLPSATEASSALPAARVVMDAQAHTEPIQYQPSERTSPSAITPDETHTSSDPSGTLDLDAVIKVWKQVRSTLRSMHPAVEPLLNSCKPVEVRSGVLVLGFQSETVRALMDKPEKMEAARKAIADVLGASLDIKCIVINARGTVPPNINQDGMVATALNQGGEIVDVQD